MQKRRKKKRKTKRTEKKGTQTRRAGLVPLLLDLKVPGPLQVDVVVIIEEARFHLVLSTGHHSGWGLLHLELLLMGLRGWGIAANHLLALVNCRRGKDEKKKTGKEGKGKGKKYP